MSMLAERKVKQRWSLNPRGKLWTEDRNGFGQKMLEKMGWKHGKGLGAKEQGMTESLKIKYKNDNKGMGFTETEGWTAHEDNFSTLLGKLNGAIEPTTDEVKVTSLEKKVQKCKARINYHKYTKAKDLSKYSEKDLANIFGRKSLKEEVRDAPTEHNKDEEDGTNLFNKGSMADYFKSKFQTLRGSDGNDSNLDSENEHVGFGYSKDDEKPRKKRKYEENSDDLNEDLHMKVKKKKGKNNVVCHDEDVSEIEGGNSVSKKKSKKKRNNEEMERNSSMQGKIYELNNEDKAEKKEKCRKGENAEIKPEEESKRKKKKSKKYDDGGVTNSAFEDKQCDSNEDPEITYDDEIGSSATVEDTYECKRNGRKKSKKSKDYGIVNAAFSDNKVANDEINESIKDPQEDDLNDSKQRNKKKKKKHHEGISNPTFEEPNLNDSSFNTEETPTKKKKKKKKQKENSGIDNPTFDILSSNTETPQSLASDTGLDNPALNLTDPIINCDLMLNVTDTPVIVKTPKIPLNSSLSKVKKLTPAARRKSVRFSDVLQEHIIPNDPSERINEYISNRNELFDINTMVIEEGIKEEMQKQGIPYENHPLSRCNVYDANESDKKIVESSVQEELQRGLLRRDDDGQFRNNGDFNIRSVDKVNFFSKEGIDNRAFDKMKTRIEENVDAISNTIEKFQAEVENDLNESKANRNLAAEWLVGDVGGQIERSVRVKGGSKLCFKEMIFGAPAARYQRGDVSNAKKSYRHLIRGDITVAFNNSNLHDIPGYAVRAKPGRISKS